MAEPWRVIAQSGHSSGARSLACPLIPFYFLFHSSPFNRGWINCISLHIGFPQSFHSDTFYVPCPGEISLFCHCGLPQIKSNGIWYGTYGNNTIPYHNASTGCFECYHYRLSFISQPFSIYTCTASTAMHAKRGWEEEAADISKSCECGSHPPPSLGAS